MVVYRITKTRFYREKKGGKMKYIIFAFLMSMIYTGFLIWITVIHNKVNELVDELNKIKEAQKECDKRNGE